MLQPKRNAHMTSVSIINSWFTVQYKTARVHLVFFIKTWISVWRVYNCDYRHLLRTNQIIPRQPPSLRKAHISTDTGNPYGGHSADQGPTAFAMFPILRPGSVVKPIGVRTSFSHAVASFSRIDWRAIFAHIWTLACIIMAWYHCVCFVFV